MVVLLELLSDSPYFPTCLTPCLHSLYFGIFREVENGKETRICKKHTADNHRKGTHMQGQTDRNIHTTLNTELESTLNRHTSSKTQIFHTNQNETKKGYQNSIEFILCWPVTTGNEAYP